MKCKEFFETHLRMFFAKLGTFIGKNPVAVLAASVLLSAVLSSGVLWFEEVSNVRTEYSPLNSPSRKEYAVAKSFLNQKGTLDPSYVMVQARDDGSLLRTEYRTRVLELVKYLQNNVTVVADNRVWEFRDICEPYCDINTAFMAFLKLYDESNPSTYSYPRVDIFGTQAFIGNNVYGVNLKDDNTSISSFTTAILPFFLVSSNTNDDVIFEWMQAARREFKNPRFQVLKIEATGDALVGAEVRRMGFETAPLIIASVVLITVFVMAFSFRRDPLRSKPWESLIGCLIPLLALLVSLGLLSFFGFKFQSIIVAALFLVLSVGVDDVFIILRAWDRTNSTHKVHERMAETLEDAGPSITISSLTNAMSFFIGMTSQTPAVRSFSFFSAVAIMICFFYQLVMFTAVLALSGRREKSQKQSFLCCLKANPNAKSPLVTWFVEHQLSFIRKYSEIVCTWGARVLLAAIMVYYYYISFIGITEIRTLIALEKMALPDSYLQKFQPTFEKSLKNMQPISVFVMNPGDLREPERMNTVKQIVHDFENAQYSYGANSTFFWLQAYEDFLEFYGESEDFTYAEIPTFFKSASYFYLTSFVKYNETACDQNEPTCVSSFFFMTNFHEKIKYHELIPIVEDWRRIAEKYSEYGVYAYSDHAPFVDQTMTIDSTVWSSIGAALLCTAIACFLFIPNLVCILAACFSVLSITVGIVGILSLWGIDLDPLSMAALLMAIGFSVDFSSHIAYHFYKSKQTDPVKKIEDTLTSIGWPLVQVGLSTIVAVCPLLFKQSYLAMVFLKTIVVVVLLGMFHGLVLLPAILSAFCKKEESNSSINSERSSTRSVVRKESFYRTQALINRINQEIWHSKVAPQAPEHFNGQPALKHNIALGRTSSVQ